MVTRKRYSPLTQCLLNTLAFDALASTSAYTPQARWGQACTIVSNTLYVHGGKLDPSNQFSYNSAPNTNDLLALNLSSPFLLSDPPWRVVTGSDRPSASQGPAVSFHTLTAFSRDGILAFGGYGGPPMPIETYPDSAWLLTNLNGASGPTWSAQPSGWANEPIRRMYHAATAANGKVWITGGEKADGSALGFKTTYQYVPAVPPSSSDSFNPVASDIPDMVGHGSVLLTDGTLVLFGGYSTSQYTMLPLSQLWMLDTTSSSSSWTFVTVSGTIPSSRRNFAYALLDGSKILVHGGSDASLQSAFDDGAILDLGSRSWSAVGGISGILGPRHDHFAVGLGSQAMFAFGYTTNGPAPAGLFIYDTLTNAFISMFVPPSTPTLNNPPGMPLPTFTLGSHSLTNAPGSSTGLSSSVSGPGSVIPGGTRSTGTNGNLTSLVAGPLGTNGPAGTSSRSPTQTRGSGPGPGSGSADRNKNVVGIALGSAFGAVALIIVATVIAFYTLKNHRRNAWQRSQGHSHLVWTSEGFGGDGSDELGDGAISSHLGDTLPVAAVSGWEPMKRRNSAWAVLGRGAKIPSNRNGERFDMLADEDEREFEDLGAYTGARVNRQGSGDSEGSPDAKRVNRRSASGRSWTDVVNDGVSSVKSVGAAISRKVSGGGTTNPDWLEKDAQFLEDEARLLPDSTVLDIGVGTAPVRMSSHMRSSEADSTLHSQSSSYYRDPYTDGIEDEPLIVAQASRSNVEDVIQQSAARTSDGLKKAHPASSIPPQATLIPLSPVISGPSDQSHSSVGSQPQSSSGSSSTRMQSSAETYTTILSTAPTAPLRRSDSWWSRFSRTSLRGGTHDSLSSNGTRRLSFRRAGPLSPSSDPKYTIDFRDPNPAPTPIRLHAIEESTNTPDVSPESAGARDTRNKRATEKLNVMPSAYALHGRSTSSLQTAVTADSDMLERMGGKVPVIRRMQTASTTHSLTPSSSPSVSSSSEQRGMVVGSSNEIGEIVSSASTGSDLGKPVLTGPRPLPLSPRRSRLNLPPAGVSDRIAEYERRTALAAVDRHPGEPKLSPVPAENAGEQQERHNRARGNSVPSSARIEWGLSERPSLFVANPDRRRDDSGDTGEGHV